MRTLVLSLLLALTGAAPALAQIELPARYRAAGELRWGSDAEGGAPFVYADPADPQHEIGFEVDLAAELARVLGVRMKRLQAPWEHLVEVLNRGDCDLVLNGFEPTPNRLPQVTFSRPYYIFQQQLSAVADATIRSLDDCAGKRVGCLGQSESELVLRRHAGKIDVQIYEDAIKAYEDVVNGRNVAALADLPIALAHRAKFPGLRPIGAPFGECYYSVAVRNGERALRDALDTALAQLLQEGALERIYRKWGMWSPVQNALGEVRLATKFGGSAPAAVTFDWGASLGLMGEGALWTIGISLAAMGLAIVLGMLVALARLYGAPPLRWLAVAYVELFRGTPVLVQLLLIYYGLGQFKALQMPNWVAGILGLGLNYAAYEAEIYRGALSAIPRGQVEAAWSLGLSGPATLRLVVLPQALRLSLAATTNDFIALFKDSSVVMVITVVELTKQYNMLASASGYHITLGLVTSAMYLAMSLPLAWCARRFELSLDRDRS